MEQGGNFFTQKVMGLPMIMWIAIVAGGAYFLFMRNSSAGQGSPSTSGGGGTITTGSTTLQKGAVAITVTQEPGKVKTGPGKKPPKHPRKKRGGGGTGPPARGGSQDKGTAFTGGQAQPGPRVLPRTPSTSHTRGRPARVPAFGPGQRTAPVPGESPTGRPVAQPKRPRRVFGPGQRRAGGY